VVAYATEPSSANGSTTSPVVVPTEDKTPSTSSDIQGSSGGVLTTHVAAVQVPSQAEIPNSTNRNRVEPAVVTDTDASDAPGQPVDPRLRRPLTDPRLRRPPQTNPRTVGPVSDPRTQGPAANSSAGMGFELTMQGSTTDLRARASPSNLRRVPATVRVGPAPNSVDPAIARPIDLNEDEMSISEESHHGACFAAVSNLGHQIWPCERLVC
jgi:hypothetical protein